MWIVLLLFVLVVIWLVREGARGRDNPGRSVPPPGQARNRGLDILDERYAKGEISKEEYEQKKKDILAS